MRGNEEKNLMKNKFTIENAVMLLIDHQQGTIKLARNLPHAEIVQNTRALARTAVYFAWA